MAKELPFFKFTVQEWQNGNIVQLSDSAQGAFINVCCYYWAKDCEVTSEMLHSRFKSRSKTIQKLIEIGSIKDQNGIVSISFLDQQLSELKQNQSFYSEMGKLGQKVKKSKAPLKPPLNDSLSYKIREDKDKKKNKNITPKNKKHSFDNSPLKNPEYFKSYFEKVNWAPEKMKFYYLAAIEYSGSKGAKYLDWGLAIKSWDRRNPYENRNNSPKTFAERDGEILTELMEGIQRSYDDKRSGKTGSIPGGDNKNVLGLQ